VVHDVIATCPVCAHELSVTRLRCGDCGTTIEGEFAVGRFGRLTREQTAVLESFLRSRGTLRDMERELAISYPTVRARVEALVRAIVEEKLADSQLDDAQLSVGDMERIVEVYSRVLVSMYHARCEYPPMPETARRPIGADQHREPSRA